MYLNYTSIKLTKHTWHSHCYHVGATIISLLNYYSLLTSFPASAFPAFYSQNSGQSDTKKKKKKIHIMLRFCSKPSIMASYLSKIQCPCCVLHIRPQRMLSHRPHLPLPSPHSYLHPNQSWPPCCSSNMADTPFCTYCLLCLE